MSVCEAVRELKKSKRDCVLLQTGTNLGVDVAFIVMLFKTVFVCVPV